MFYVVKPLDVDTEPKVFFTPKAAQEYKQERERIGGHGPIVSATGFPSCSVSQKFRQLGDVPAIRRASSRVYHKPKSLYSKGWSMKFPKTALIAGSLLFILAARISAEGLGVLGQGNASCSSWLENHTSNDARIAWILGYVTGFNQYGSSKPSDVSLGTTAEEMMVFINKYCRNHPTDNLYAASAALVDQFRQKPGH